MQEGKFQIDFKLRFCHNPAIKTFSLLAILIFFVGLGSFFIGRLTANTSSTIKDTNQSVTQAKETPVPSPTIVSKWQTYTSTNPSQIIYTLEYPDGWNMDSNAPEGQYMTEFTSKELVPSVDESFVPALRISITTSNNNPENLAQYMQDFYCHEKNSTCPDVKLARDFTVDGQPAKDLEPYTYNDSAMIVSKKGSKTVILSMNQTNNNYHQKLILYPAISYPQQILQHMAATFKFKD